MIAFPNAKINLGLNILEKLPNGYHNIETIFIPTDLCDIIEIVESSNFSFESSGLKIPGKSEDNLVIKACKLLKQDFDFPKISIHLHKKIPFGAGLGGGSSDAAITLKMINKKFSLGLSENKLMDYASKLGADCAFFIKNKTQLGEGIGNKFSDISIELKEKYLLIVHPGIFVSTAESYKNVEINKDDISLLKASRNPIDKWQDLITNSFEKTVFSKYPSIQNLKEDILNMGAVYASMSGSGSAVYGIFNEKPKKVNLPTNYFYHLSGF